MDEQPERLYDGPFRFSDAQRYFELSWGERRSDVVATTDENDVHWQDVSFEVRPGLSASATIVSTGKPSVGVVLAHGGSDDGRRFFRDKAARLARRGAVVMLPVTRFPEHSDMDAVARAIRDAVLTERRALAMLSGRVGASAPSFFLGHSAGGFLGAHLAALEPRLSGVVIFGYGRGTFPRFAVQDLNRVGRVPTTRDRRIMQWLEPANYLQIPNGRRLLVQHGRGDVEVPIAEGRARFAAAADPKQWAEYGCGHAIDADPAARADRADFVFG